MTKQTISAVSMDGANQAHLIDGHREGVNVTAFRGAFARQDRLLRGQKQLWGHVTHVAELVYHRATI